jgi:hypothetical protein
MDGSPDAWIRAAAADIPGHRFVDILIGGLGIFVEQHGGAHDLAGLAVAALRHVDFDPGALEWMRKIVREAFDGGDMFAGHARQGGYARTYGLPFEMHGAGSAQSHPTAEFCASQSQGISNNPEQRSRRIVIHVYGFSIQEERSHERPPHSRFLSLNTNAKRKQYGIIGPGAPKLSGKTNKNKQILERTLRTFGAWMPGLERR